MTMDPRTSEKRDGGRDGRRMSTRFYTCVLTPQVERGSLGGGRVIRALSSSASTSEARSALLPPSLLEFQSRAKLFLFTAKLLLCQKMVSIITCVFHSSFSGLGQANQKSHCKIVAAKAKTRRTNT